MADLENVVEVVEEVEVDAIPENSATEIIEEKSPKQKNKKELSWKAIIAIAIGAAAVVIAIVAFVTNKTRNYSGPVENEYIKISQYKGIEYDGASTSVTDEDVEAQIESEMSANQKESEVTDRAVQVGDYVNVNYVGTVDGTEFDGGSASDTELEITADGTGYVDGFISGIVGHKTGEEFDVNVTFPSDYGVDELNGKAAVFHFTLNKIYTKEMPELTDKYVKKYVDGCDTVEEYKAQVKEELEANNEENNESTIKSTVWQQILDNTTVKKYPEGAVEKEVEAYKNTYEAYAEQYGLSFADFLDQYLSTTEEEFETQVQQAAEDTVKQQLVVELIAEKEGLDLSESEYKSKLDEMATQYGYDDGDALLEAYESQMSEDDFKNYILMNIVEDYVADLAVAK